VKFKDNVTALPNRSENIRIADVILADDAESIVLGTSIADAFMHRTSARTAPKRSLQK
jgi:hypothetical protein